MNKWTLEKLMEFRQDREFDELVERCEPRMKKAANKFNRVLEKSGIDDFKRRNRIEDAALRYVTCAMDGGFRAAIYEILRSDDTSQAELNRFLKTFR